MTDRPYADEPLSTLYQEYAEAKAAADMCKETMRTVEVELAARFSAPADQKLSGASGSWSNTVPSGGASYVVKATADKDVTWDSDALLKLALSMPFEEAARIFDIAVKIKERTYAALTGRVREAAELARTVQVKPLKFSIERKA